MVEGISCAWKENYDRKEWNMRREEKGKGDLPSLMVHLFRLREFSSSGVAACLKVEVN